MLRIRSEDLRDTCKLLQVCRIASKTTKMRARSSVHACHHVRVRVMERENKPLLSRPETGNRYDTHTRVQTHTANFSFGQTNQTDDSTD